MGTDSATSACIFLFAERAGAVLGRSEEARLVCSVTFQRACIFESLLRARVLHSIARCSLSTPNECQVSQTINSRASTGWSASNQIAVNRNVNEARVDLFGQCEEREHHLRNQTPGAACQHLDTG